MGAAAILLAGGGSTRLGGTGSKVYETVGGRPLLAFSLEVCALAPSVDRCVIVIRPGDVHLARSAVDLVPGAEVTLVTGGPTRHASEIAGLGALRGAVRSGELDTIAIHDAARPFASVDLFERVIAAARVTGGGIPGIGFDEALYHLGREGPEALAGDRVVRVQTPQAFGAADLLRAYDAAPTDLDAVDTAETVAWAGGVAVAVVPGHPDNIKVTYAEDLVRAGRLADRWRNGDWM
jgi:2-C-methyl-D-erythritol 4-phosphate cytidylyltransferase